MIDNSNTIRYIQHGTGLIVVQFYGVDVVNEKH